MTTLTVPVQAAVAEHRAEAAPRRPRHSLWPYAGIVSALSGYASVLLLAQGQDQFDLDHTPSTAFVVEHLHHATWIKLGGAAALLSVVAGLVFLLGLGRFVQKLAPARAGLHTALRMSTTAFLATATIGAVMRYIVAGGAHGGIDKNIYTVDSVATLSALGDQLACASYLPALLAMGLVGWVAVRERVLARPVGVIALVLAGGSLAATLVLGLPYSSALVYPVFAALVGLNGILARRAV
jgi:hypothetical protein